MKLTVSEKIMRKIIGLTLVFLILGLSVFGQNPDVGQLVPNQTIEREMIGKQTDLYRFELKTDEFFQVRVEQKGVDVRLTITDETGKSLAAMDSPNGTDGAEILSFVAPENGSYRLEISSSDEKGEKGSYNLKATISEKASARDRRRIEAEKLFVEGMSFIKPGGAEIALEKLNAALTGWRELGDVYLTDLTAKQIELIEEAKKLIEKRERANILFSEAFDLLNQKTAESLGGAIEKFAAAAELYGEVGDVLKQGVSLLSAGNISQRLGDMPNSLKHYNLALPLFRSIGEKKWEAITLNNIGGYYDNKGDKKKALEIYVQTLALHKEIGDADGEGTIINNIATIYSNAGDQQKALEYANRALEIFRRTGEKSRESVMLNNLGGIYNDLGDPKKALEFYNQSLVLSEQGDDKTRTATTLTNIGSVYNHQSDYQKALEFYDKALPIFRKAGNKSGEATILNNVALTFSNLGEREKALKTFDQSLSLYRQIEDKNGEATTLGNIGIVYIDLGETEKALDFYKRALEIFLKTGDKSGQATSYNNIAGTYKRLENKEKTIEFYEKALAIFRQIESKNGEALTLNNIGANYAKNGDYKKALEFYEKSLALRKQLGDKGGEANTLNNIGRVYDDLGEFQKALAHFNEALPMFNLAGKREEEATLLGNLMYLWKELKNPQIAAFYGKQAVNKYQQLRQAISGLDAETQKTYLETVKDTYRKLADLLIEQGQFAQAEKILRMLKEEEFFDFVRRDSNEVKNLSQQVPLNEQEKALIERYSAISGKIAEIGQEFGKLDEKKRRLSRSDLTLSADESKRYEELEKQLDDANAAFQLFLNKELTDELGEQKKKDIEVDRNLQTKLRKWGAGTVALYTVVGADRYRVILTTATTQTDGKTEISAADLNKKVFAFRAALQNPNVDPRPLAKELYDVLIKPIEKDLKAADAKTLIWSLDGTLRYIPLAALSPDGEKYLAEDFQNVIITAKTRDDISDSNADWEALGLGVSDAQTVVNPDDATKKISFIGLPGTQRELLTIVKDEKTAGENGVLPGKRLLNNEFTPTSFKDFLGKENEEGRRKYNVIHIASHFQLGSNWTNSFLLLGDGQILTLEEINNSSRINFEDVELVTLSACNTGFANDTNGKEIDSLAEVIQTKSGKAVMATLWAVADESTSVLMSEFYRLRKENPQMTKAEAIRQAQIKFINGEQQTTNETTQNRSGVFAPAGTETTQKIFKTDEKRRFAHPYYWSPFVLIGNWR